MLMDADVSAAQMQSTPTTTANAFSAGNKSDDVPKHGSVSAVSFGAPSATFPTFMQPVVHGGKVPEMLTAIAPQVPVEQATALALQVCANPRG